MSKPLAKADSGYYYWRYEYGSGVSPKFVRWCKRQINKARRRVLKRVEAE